MHKHPTTPTGVLLSFPEQRRAVPGATPYDGLDLAGDVFDLIRERLPRLTPDDPMRSTLAAVLPLLGAAIGRDRLGVAR